MSERSVIGREQERASIREFLASVAEGPRALVLSGEPGIGKTVLWEEGVGQAERRLTRVLVHRGIEAEAPLSFAGLSDLLAPVLEDVAPSLPSPRRHALEVALWLADPGERPPEQGAIGLAVLDVLRALASDAPVVVALDDLQWLDAASAGVLQIALRRLRDEPVGLLATLRSGAELAAPLELERTFQADRFEQLTVGPLTLAELHRLLKERLGLELTRPELGRLVEVTAGNPFFAIELGRELVRTNTRPAPGRALRVPEGLHELLGGRLARLPAETVDVLLQVAALARPNVDLVAAAYGDRGRVIAALEAASQEGVVELDDSRIRFSHALLASICLEQAPLWKRRAVHRALAGSVVDVEERARHLALAAEGPDAAVAAELDAAAEQAAVRGATAAAAELSELAAELTPEDAPQGRRRRLAAAHFHRLAGDFARAAAILDRLREHVPGGAERADVLFERALTRTTSPQTMIELCGEALSEASDDDARSARILAYQSFIRLFQTDVHGGLEDARAALAKAERADDPALIAVAIARVGHAETWAGLNTPGLVERGAEMEERLGLALEYYESPRVAFARILTALGGIEQGRAILEELVARAAARGDEPSRGQLLWRLSLLEWYAGNLRLALEHADVAFEIAEQNRDLHQRAFQGRIKALVEADLGLVDEARSSAESGLAYAQQIADEVNVTTCLGALGRLELALGNFDGAAGYLRDLPERLLTGGFNEPTSPIWADAIDVLVTVGELDRARAYLVAHEEHARRFGSRWAVAGAERCRGLLAAREGDLPAAVAAYERSLDELAGMPHPLERGRTLLCLGAVRRQAQERKAARDALDQALAIFDELGARLWAAKAQAELARISGRRAPSSEELTGTEQRVAELAAQGRSNKEIAAELYMGVSTVEAHLSRVYRKLDVRRAGLAARLAMPTDEEPKAMDAAVQP
jgi:DNA-binding CsgD family transcriptional regulator